MSASSALCYWRASREPCFAPTTGRKLPEEGRDFLAAFQQAIADGKSAAEAFAGLRLPERYKDYDLRQARANVDAIYRELGR